MDDVNVKESLELLRSIIEQVQSEEEDEYIGWFFKRMLTNVRSISLLLQGNCDSDAHVIERVLLEHCARVLHFKLNPPSIQDVQLFKSKHKPSASEIMDKYLGDSSVYMMLSAFTHTDSFSLAFEDDLQDTSNIQMAHVASEFISWASMAISLELLAKAYPSVKELYPTIPGNVLSALGSLGDSLVESASFASMSLDDETRKLLPNLMGWKIRDQVIDLLSRIEKPSDIREVIAKHIRSVTIGEKLSTVSEIKSRVQQEDFGT